MLDEIARTAACSDRSAPAAKAAAKRYFQKTVILSPVSD
jgi:hypothetical protein